MLATQTFLASVKTGIAVAMIVLAQLDSATPLPRLAPLEPSAAKKSFAIKDGFELQLIAAEPLVTDPVAAVYDEKGRLFVVEMNDYPYTDKTTDKPNVERTRDLPIGKIRLLIDTDDDGVFDQSTIFARDLSWPTGIAVYDGGVFVAATPDLWYLKDTDGDNVCDLRINVFTGFRKFNVQAVVNNLIWGLDHRIYGAGGSNGGNITSPQHPELKQVAMTRHDFRFNPRNPQFELLSGSARFGNTFDDWGRRLICNIRNPIQHVVLPQHYLARNPFLAVTSTLNDVAIAGDQIRVYRASPPEPWRIVNADRLTVQGDPRMPRSEKNAAGFMTSACGVTVYRGDAYPDQFRQQVFLAEPSGNLVHRQKLSSAGVTMTSERIDHESEFVVSTDNWFRPVNFVHAPDVTLHLLDMYRETIEHPWSMPDDLKAMLDLENGRDRGRIYRIAPPQFQRRATPNLATASIEDLVRLLEHPNVWHRETAHRLIFERQQIEAARHLRHLRQTTSIPLARLHVLWSLSGLNQLQEADLQSALLDSSSHVREHGVRLAEEFLQSHDSAVIREEIHHLATDPDAGVRFQVALTLGSIPGPRRAELLETIARRDADDPWITTAVLSSSVDLSTKLLQSLLKDLPFVSDPQHLPLLKQLAQLTGTRQKTEEIRAVSELLAEFPANAATSQIAILLALDDGLRRKGSRIDLAWNDQPQALAMLNRHVEAARDIAIGGRHGQKTGLVPDPATAPSAAERVAALRVLSCQPLAAIQQTLFSLLDLKQPQELQAAAIRTLAGYHDDELASRLLTGFTAATPPIQYEIIEALANHPKRLPKLLDAIAEGKVSAAQITPIRKTLLMNHADPKIRQRAAELIGQDRATPRQQVIAAYRESLDLSGTSSRGAKIFLRDCATCHKMGDVGHDVGPNLATIRHRRAAEILVAILDPNREVGPNFMQYAVGLDDGRILAGMIAEESATSLTLKRADSKQDVVLRQNVSEITGTGLSLMPDGFEKKLTKEEMADLLAFLRGQ